MAYLLRRSEPLPVRSPAAYRYRWSFRFESPARQRERRRPWRRCTDSPERWEQYTPLPRSSSTAALPTRSHVPRRYPFATVAPCLLYTSDAADERSSVDLGGRRI